MDLTVLVLTFFGLRRISALNSVIGNSLSEQCLWYCIGTFICNIPAVILPILNLNGEQLDIVNRPREDSCRGCSCNERHCFHASNDTKVRLK